MVENMSVFVSQLMKEVDELMMLQPSKEVVMYEFLYVMTKVVEMTMMLPQAMEEK